MEVDKQQEQEQEQTRGGRTPLAQSSDKTLNLKNLDITMAGVVRLRP